MHLMLSLSISYPYLIQIHDFADNIQKGMKHQMGGATQGQQGMTFCITLIFGFFVYHENRTLLKMSKPVRFSIWMPGENVSCSHLQWEPSIQFSSSILTGRFSLKTELKINAGFHSAGENHPTLIMTIMYLGNLLSSLTTKCKYLLYPKEGFQLCTNFSWR
jgi:hypothetical protein